MWPGKRRARVVQEARVLHRRGADDDVGDAVVEVALDGVEVADAAAELHRDLLADHAHDLADRELVARLAGDGAVEVDEVQPLRALLEPVLRHRRRILGEHGGRLHVALLQAHAMAVLDVDRGNDLHGSGEELRSRASARRGGVSGKVGLGTAVPGDEIGEERESGALALFRMELRSEDISPRDGASKRRRIVDGRRGQRRVRRHGMVAVGEVEARAVARCPPTAGAPAPAAPGSSPCAAP